ncbi:MBL fold metallo-hydrolase [Solibacillus sp. MA9]|uniref:MBL fold metallo-hydrolase n=1 Tax=Solibacillus palustris TaxID=2908203 RepID=A0ABS9UI92_9BACL|nr:MBL fold metallo-hydrolase [Solibacillus sp. MA9]
MSAVFEYNTKKVYPIIYPVKYGQMNNINCYLYEHHNKLTLIDAGIDSAEYEVFFDEQLAAYGLNIMDIDQIILTHHHIDHIGMVNKITEKKQIPVFAHPLALERLALTTTYQQTKIQFFEELYERYGCTHVMASRIEKMKQTLNEAGGLRIQSVIEPIQANDYVGELKVLDTPGHSLDSITLYDEESGWLFTGDLIIEKGTTNALIDFDSRNLLLPTVLQHRQSIEQCQKLLISTVFAGHEKIFTNFSEVAQLNIAKIDYKVQRIAKQIEQGNESVLKLANALYGNLMHTIPTLIFSEVIGYVNYAVILGIVERVQRNGQITFRCV